MVLNRLRMQLPIDPFVHPDLEHTVDLARTWPEGQPIEGFEGAGAPVRLPGGIFLVRNCGRKA